MLGDEYIITYIYKEKVEKIEAEQKVDVTIESYNNVTTNVKNTNTLNIKESENKGNIVGTTITSVSYTHLTLPTIGG